jgi:hypothetical protein
MKEGLNMTIRKPRRESRTSEGRPAGERSSVWEPVEVECYSGYRAEETPRAVTLGGKRLEVAEVLSRKRLRDSSTHRTFEVFHCRLVDGRPVSLERSEEGTWRGRFPAAVRGRENRARRIIAG